jgi:hypothetical protein
MMPIGGMARRTWTSPRRAILYIAQRWLPNCVSAWFPPIDDRGDEEDSHPDLRRIRRPDAAGHAGH